MEKPFTAEELEEALTNLMLAHYNLSAQAADIPMAENLTEADDPGLVAQSLIKAIATVWGQNNKRMEDYIRRVSYGAGGRSIRIS